MIHKRNSQVYQWTSGFGGWAVGTLNQKKNVLFPAEASSFLVEAFSPLAYLRFLG